MPYGVGWMKDGWGEVKETKGKVRMMIVARI